jgi:hypothetical protein
MVDRVIATFGRVAILSWLQTHKRRNGVSTRV